MKNFQGFGLNPALSASLERMNYTQPTPIQAQAIPLALEGRDIMGSAQTGTGKTAAFAIPVVEMLMTTDVDCALILTPTRELGKQVMDIMHQLLGPKSGVKTAFLIGGEPMGKQINALSRRPRLVVGTPGRINDHLERGNLYLEETTLLVLDETDRMLDMGFSVQLDRIFKYLPNERQTLMFSATLPKNILKLSEQYMNNPERVAVGSTTDPSKNIKQEIIRLDENSKYDELVNQLDKRSGSVIVFVKTRHNTEKLAKRLSQEGYDAEAIHGELRQSRRDRVIRDFRSQKYRILVATDVAARGIDIPHIEHVINYDLPQVAEDYIHRIGRTARAGAEGEALCLISPQDGRKWHAIEQLIDPSKKSSASVRPLGGKGRKSNSRGGAGFKGRGGRGGEGFKARVAKGENPYSNNRKKGLVKARPARDEAAQGEGRKSDRRNNEKRHSEGRYNDNRQSDNRKNERGDKRRSEGFKGRPSRDENAQAPSRKHSSGPKKPFAKGDKPKNDRYKSEGGKGGNPKGGEGFRTRPSKGGAPKGGAKKFGAKGGKPAMGKGAGKKQFAGKGHKRSAA
ncbi:MAG TPA: DEAD/DEAH box helicase [Micavibrio sp.]|nr:DEAD/DEAH box helicase [Micavibrio sp.]HIL28381.1 DEAD/DEAH box helicase [Micavibrio sp.]